MNLRFIHAFTALTLYSCELCCVVSGETQPVGIDDLNPLVVTPEGGFSQPLVTSAWAISYSETNSRKLMSRSLAESLSGIPSVMIQKTALGQSSPYIRGLTGYHNLLLVDGIRLNHSAMRSGPNQYWSTVELFSSDRVETLRGTHGVLFGAETVGGVVNSLSNIPYYSESNTNQSTQILARLSSAENSWSGGISSEISSPDWFAEISHIERSFGDLEGGKMIGKQKKTGYNSRGSQARLSKKLSEDSNLIFGFQQTFMDDVPRTHKTIDALNWEGLSAGSEIWRRLDQKRNLYYGRVNWEDIDGIANSGQVTLSLHTHDQERNRMKGSSGIAQGGDFQYFNLNDFGLTARFEKKDFLEGNLFYGTEWHNENLDSGGYKFDTNTNKTSELLQGPLAADASYNRIATYIQSTQEFDSGWTIQPGIRYAKISANLKRFYRKNSDASTLFDPEEKSYEEVIGSFRVTKSIIDEIVIFGGFSQGFRPPSLYDLTSTDETSAVERPNTKLESEQFLQSEVGMRGVSDSLSWQTSFYHTWIKDMIVRSPIESGKSEVLKSNGDGFIQGFELELAYRWSPSWKSDFSFSWMKGEVEQLLDNNSTGSIPIDGRNYSIIERATTRLMPTQINLKTQFEPVGSNWSSVFSLLAVGKADRLSLKDETDITRIPSSGTPNYFLANIYTNYNISDFSTISLAIENIGDVDYRVHGSGINGAGRNFIFSCSLDF